MLEDRQFFMHDDPSRTFRGVRFVLFGFDSAKEDKVRLKLLQGGAVDAKSYGPECTHVIVENIVYDDPLCIAARNDGKVLVTGLWIGHSCDAQLPMDPTSIMYRPMRDLAGIPGARSLVICLTGYLRADRDDIMTMVSLMGAAFSKPLVANKVTHLICYKFEGEKYELAKKLKKINLVNHLWLEDCLKAWRLLPEADYSKSGFELEFEAEAKDSEEETENMPAVTDLGRKIIVSPQNTDAGNRSFYRSPVKHEILGTSSSSVLKTLSYASGSHKVQLNSAKEISAQKDLETPSLSNSKLPGKLSPEVSFRKNDPMISKMAEAFLQVPSESAHKSPGGGVPKSSSNSFVPSNLERMAGTSGSPSLSKLNKHGVADGHEMPFEGVTDGIASGILEESASKSPDDDVARFRSRSTSGSNAFVPLNLERMSVNSGSPSPSKLEKHGVVDCPEVPFEGAFDGTASGILEGSAHKSPNGDVPNFRSRSTSGRNDFFPLNLESMAVSSGSLLQLRLHQFGGVDDPEMPFDGLPDGTTIKTPVKGTPFSNKRKENASCLVSGSSKSKRKPLTGVGNKILEALAPRSPVEGSRLPGCNSSHTRRNSSPTRHNSFPAADSYSREGISLQLEASKSNSMLEGRESNVVTTEHSDEISKKTSLSKEDLMNLSSGQTNSSPGDIEMHQDELQNNSVSEKKEVQTSKPRSVKMFAKKSLGTKRGYAKGRQPKNGPIDLNKGVLPLESTPLCDEEKTKEISDNTIIPEKIAMASHCTDENASMQWQLNVSEKADDHSKDDKSTGVNTAQKRSKKGKKRPLAKSKTNVLVNGSDENGNYEDNRREEEGNTLPKNEKTRVLDIPTKGSSKKKMKSATAVDMEKENKTTVSSTSVHSPTVYEKKTETGYFILSGHRVQRKEFQSVIKKLKGRVCRDSHQWSYQATHFIVPEPVRRTEKFFAAAASGRWILKSDYLTACIEAGRFVDEEPYEWHAKCLTEDGAINMEAPRKWRFVREKTGHGAFYGMKIVIYGECIAPPLETLKRVVKAGGGTILATSPPYTRFLRSKIDFAIISPGMPRVDMWIQEFIRQEVPCVLADYLVEFVCKPGYSQEKHVQYCTHKWAEQSLCDHIKRIEETEEDENEELRTPDDGVSGGDELTCKICGKGDGEDEMLICGDENGQLGCGVGFHIYCLDPPLESVPKEDWFCSSCTNKYE